MIEKRKIKMTMAHRRKKGLCEKCGKYEIDSKHACLENYLCADTRNSTPEEILEAHNQLCEEVSKPVIVPEPPIQQTVKELKEKLMPKKEETAKKLGRPFSVKKTEEIKIVPEVKQVPIIQNKEDGTLRYVVIENLTNYMDYDFLNFMSKYYFNRYFFMLLVKNDFINSLPYNMLKINKIINIIIKNIESENIDLNKLIEDSKCVFTNNQKIIQCCNEMNHKYVIMPEKVSIESIKSNPNYWEIV